jgi:hypothetical protein
VLKDPAPLKEKEKGEGRAFRWETWSRTLHITIFFFAHGRIKVV